MLEPSERLVVAFVRYGFVLWVLMLCVFLIVGSAV